MYFYHEHYQDAHIATALEDWQTGTQREDGSTFEPIRVPAIINWLVVTAIALLIIASVIHALN